MGHIDWQPHVHWPGQRTNRLLVFFTFSATIILPTFAYPIWRLQPPPIRLSDYASAQFHSPFSHRASSNHPLSSDSSAPLPSSSRKRGSSGNIIRHPRIPNLADRLEWVPRRSVGSRDPIEGLSMLGSGGVAQLAGTRPS